MRVKRLCAGTTRSTASSPDELHPDCRADRAGPRADPWVLREAMQQCARWRAEGRMLGISVNVSARDLLDRTFVTTVRETLRDCGVPSSALCLEVTETSIMADPERASAVLREFCASGVLFPSTISDLATRRWPTSARSRRTSSRSTARSSRRCETATSTVPSLRPPCTLPIDSGCRSWRRASRTRRHRRRCTASDARRRRDFSSPVRCPPMTCRDGWTCGRPRSRRSPAGGSLLPREEPFGAPTDPAAGLGEQFGILLEERHPEPVDGARESTQRDDAHAL